MTPNENQKEDLVNISGVAVLIAAVVTLGIGLLFVGMIHNIIMMIGIMLIVFPLLCGYLIHAGVTAYENEHKR